MNLIAKKIPIKSANKPTENTPVSGIVLIADSKGLGYCAIKVEQELVEFLGRKMPYGVGPENQVYIKIIQNNKKYEMYCCYEDKSKKILISIYDNLPNWVKRIKYK